MLVLYMLLLCVLSLCVCLSHASTVTKQLNLALRIMQTNYMIANGL